MPNNENIETTPAAPEHDDEQGPAAVPAPPRLAAVVEAAYILEAVRK